MAGWKRGREEGVGMEGEGSGEERDEEDKKSGRE